MVKNLKNNFGKEKSAKAVMKFIRISPRKIRLDVDTVRNKPIHRALGILATSPRKGAKIIHKALASVVANAKVAGLDEDKLYISHIFADGGPTLKRFRPRSMGRADRILKRTSHLSIVVSEGNKSNAKPKGLMQKAAEEETTKSKKKGRKKAAAK